MDRRSLAWASALLILGVALGAFGAHGLKPRVEPTALDQWHTGVLYQFVHGLGMLALAGLGERLPRRTLTSVRILFIAGILCFSGSLYLLSTRELTGMPWIGAVVGPITPIGGLLFVAGWGWLLITALRGRGQR